MKAFIQCENTDGIPITDTDNAGDQTLLAITPPQTKSISINWKISGIIGTIENKTEFIEL